MGLSLQEIDDELVNAMALVNRIQSADSSLVAPSLALAHLTVSVLGILREIVELKARVDKIEGK